MGVAIGLSLVLLWPQRGGSGATSAISYAASSVSGEASGWRGGGSWRVRPQVPPHLPIEVYARGPSQDQAATERVAALLSGNERKQLRELCGRTLYHSLQVGAAGRPAVGGARVHERRVRGRWPCIAAAQIGEAFLPALPACQPVDACVLPPGALQTGWVSHETGAWTFVATGGASWSGKWCAAPRPAPRQPAMRCSRRRSCLPPCLRCLHSLPAVSFGFSPTPCPQPAGDLPLMWIRDSAVQIGVLLPRLAKRPALRRVVEGAIRAQVYTCVACLTPSRLGCPDECLYTGCPAWVRGCVCREVPLPSSTSSNGSVYAAAAAYTASVSSKATSPSLPLRRRPSTSRKTLTPTATSQSGSTQVGPGMRETCCRITHTGCRMRGGTCGCLRGRACRCDPFPLQPPTAPPLSLLHRQAAQGGPRPGARRLGGCAQLRARLWWAPPGVCARVCPAQRGAEGVV